VLPFKVFQPMPNKRRESWIGGNDLLIAARANPPTPRS
jgi:hypothetical protein